MLNGVMFNVVKLNVVMFSVVKLNVVMFSVVASKKDVKQFNFKNKKNCPLM